MVALLLVHGTGSFTLSLLVCSNVRNVGDNPYIDALPRILGVKRVGRKLKEFMRKASAFKCFTCLCVFVPTAVKPVLNVHCVMQLPALCRNCEKHVFSALRNSCHLSWSVACISLRSFIGKNGWPEQTGFINSLAGWISDLSASYLLPLSLLSQVFTLSASSH